ncbi:Folylpolyglutamate synthase [Hirsutella minnesotensis 3608]|nr:Folylpolyglutamate synthase [Hirsutella minnesotensis 3608]
MAMTSSARSYNDAIDALNSLQTSHAVIEARRKAGMRPDAASMREMKVYLKRIGYTPADLDRLNIVHVAGTKGKGSTCAFVDSILGRYRRSLGVPRRSGLFISPHLVAVRERIRIDSAPLSEELFARYFFDVWDRLGASATAGHDDDGVPPGTRPLYGRFLTLVSWHAFLQEGVDAAVYETGIGGEYDATNLVERPAAAGITTLGIDHVHVLGDTVAQIAWHKAGIVNRRRAGRGGAVEAWRGTPRGRCEVKVEDKVTWYLDGAHTIDSLKMSSQWFAKETAECPGPRVIVFNQQSRSEAVDFLESIHTAVLRDPSRPSFDHAVFCTNVTYADAGYKRDFVNNQIDPLELRNLTVQHRFAAKWSELDPAANVVVLPSIEEALDYVRHLGSGLGNGESVRAYVTGSLHLVGGALGILEQADAL